MRLRSAAIAIVGGGIIGTAIAYELVRRGTRAVALFEADTIGQASTRHSIGGIRSIFSHPLEVALSQHSLEAFHDLEYHARTDFGFRASGYLLLATNQARRNTLLGAAAHAARQGVPVERLTRRRVAALIPGVVASDVLAAVLSPADGWMPDAAAPAVAYGRLAAAGGAAIFEHTSIARVRAAGSGFALAGPGGRWKADRAIIAVNAYAQSLLQPLGVQLPAHPYPRHAFTITPVPRGFNPGMPITVFQNDDILIRYDGRQLTVVCGLRQESTLALALPAPYRPDVRRRLGRRLAVRGRRIRLAFSGLRSMTPDRRMLVGSVPGVPGMWCAIGCSGHGFMHAPAIAHAVADMVLEVSPPRFDLTALDPGRFGALPDRPPILDQAHY